MDIFLHLPNYIYALIIFLLTASLYSLISKPVLDRRDPPQLRGKLPFIGHLHLLKGPKHITRTLSELADEYGPVFTLWLGANRVVVVSNPEAAKTCFTSADLALASRPEYAIGKLMGYGNKLFGLVPNGVYWSWSKKIATVHLLSNSRLDVLRDIRIDEVDICIKELHNLWKEEKHNAIHLDINTWIEDLTYNIIINMVTSKRYFGSTGEERDDAQRFRRSLEEFFRLTLAFVPSDMFPYLCWLDWFSLNVAAMKSVAKEFDDVLNKLLVEHRWRKADGGGDRDFMDVLISNLEENTEFLGLNVDMVIKASSLSLILAGSETSSVTIELTLAAILANPHTLAILVRELDTQIGKDRLVTESDLKNLPYLQAVIKETLRLYPTAALLIPHLSVQECKIQEFRVPEKTQVWVNLLKLHRDPTVWSNPDKFEPDRFMSDHQKIELWGQHFELMPFGSGRRACPGATLAIRVIELTIARLVQGFELEITSEGEVDVLERMPGSGKKKHPLDVMLIPRLADHLYA